MNAATTTTGAVPTLPAVTAMSDPAAQLAIDGGCRALHLPTVRAEAGRIAEAAARERLSHKAFLAEVLTAECDDRDARRRIRRVLEAKFPRTKRLADFDLSALPTCWASRSVRMSASRRLWVSGNVEGPALCLGRGLRSHAGGVTLTVSS